MICFVWQRRCQPRLLVEKAGDPSRRRVVKEQHARQLHTAADEALQLVTQLDGDQRVDARVHQRRVRAHGVAHGRLHRAEHIVQRRSRRWCFAPVWLHHFFISLLDLLANDIAFGRGWERRGCQKDVSDGDPGVLRLQSIDRLQRLQHSHSS